MWLIEVRTRKLQWFTDNECPEYTILSHTWGTDELSFQEFQEAELHRERLSYQKIDQCCMQSEKDGYSFCWVDAVCIDKKSTNELSEAINSMFKWYNQAAVCYAYLADSYGSPEQSQSNESTYTDTVESTLSQCRWFRRGWTLQELIAPIEVRFFNADWNAIAIRSEIPDVLAEITGIDQLMLQWPRQRGTSTKSTRSQYGTFAGADPSSSGRKSDLHNCLQLFSVAQRMSWASSRSTTRPEDEAYSLLGLFDITMPLVYGEGSKAFTRLQEEIIKTFMDQSILAWDYPVDMNGVEIDREAGYLLAPSPRFFAGAQRIVRDNSNSGTSTTFEMTNIGLRLSTPTRSDEARCSKAVLNCAWSNNVIGPIAIWIMQDPGGYYYAGGNKSETMFGQKEQSRLLVVARETLEMPQVTSRDIVLLRARNIARSSGTKEEQGFRVHCRIPDFRAKVLGTNPSHFESGGEAHDWAMFFHRPSVFEAHAMSFPWSIRLEFWEQRSTRRTSSSHIVDIIFGIGFPDSQSRDKAWIFATQVETAESSISANYRKARPYSHYVLPVSYGLRLDLRIRQLRKELVSIQITNTANLADREASARQQEIERSPQGIVDQLRACLELDCWSIFFVVFLVVLATVLIPLFIPPLLRHRKPLAGEHGS